MENLRHFVTESVVANTNFETDYIFCTNAKLKDLAVKNNFNTNGSESNSGTTMHTEIVLLCMSCKALRHNQTRCISPMKIATCLYIPALVSN